MKNYETSYILADFLRHNYKPESADDFKRVEYIDKLMNAVKRENFQDAGITGKVLEVTSRPSTSKLIIVQSSNKADAFMNIDGKRIRLEVKSNGGRLEDLYSIRKPEKVIIRYTLLMRTPQGKPKKDGTCKPAETRFADVLMRLDEFLALLESVNAIKVIEHKDYVASDRERAIQADSKKLYMALQNRMKFDRNKEYHLTDFNM